MVGLLKNDVRSCFESLGECFLESVVFSKLGTLTKILLISSSNIDLSSLFLGFSNSGLSLVLYLLSELLN